MKSAFLALVAVLAMGCSSPQQADGGAAAAPATPKFTNIILTDNEDSKEPKTTFNNETPNLYVLFGLENVPNGTKLKGAWICEKAENIPPDFKIDEASLTTGPLINSGKFSISKPNAGWPFGEYRVELYMGEKLEETVKFTIGR